MSWDAPDVYDNPSHFGLEVLGTIEWDDYDYEFNMTLVAKDADGKLYWGSDSGCSCPSPFEDFCSLADLTTGTAEELDAHLDELLAHRLARIDQYSDHDPSGDVAELKLKVRS